MGLFHFSKKEMKHVPKKTPCKDHLGNTFLSITAMCKHYGISPDTFNKRRNEKQMSIEEALTTPVEKRQTGSCKDHLGNVFPSKKAMYKHYGISKKTYVNRIEKRHMSLKAALTTPLEKTPNELCKDHLGNEFPSVKAMCKHYGISPTTFRDRRNKKHMSIKDALTTPVTPMRKHKGSCKDHLGNEFPNKKAMCKHYGISSTVFNYRRNKTHMSLKDALTTPVEKRKTGSCKDHLGNEFPSENAMCKHYGINYITFYKRMTEKHISLKNALTTPVEKNYNGACKDHLGNEFPSETAMCEHYNIKYYTFKRRIDKQHMSLKDALTTPVKKNHNGVCKDHLGNEFPNIMAMCKHYGIKPATLYTRMNKNHMSLKKALTKPQTIYKDHLGNEFPSKTAMCEHYGVTCTTFDNRINSSIEEALGVIPYICFKTKNTHITNNLFIKEVKTIGRKMLYAVCIYNDTETLLTHDEIIEIYRNETRNAP